jgi:DNA-directed RNA polymerase specialized sigma24 family protein
LKFRLSNEVEILSDLLVQREKKKWSLTSEAFSQLLASLDSDRERAGEKYEQIRGGLECFFRWRGCLFPEEHADETLNRVARKISDGNQISDPYTYVYGVARMLLLEIFKEREREQKALANMPSPETSQPDAAEHVDTELRVNCLMHCLEELPLENKNFITQYYQGEKRSKIENRKRLAERLRIPLNALRLRARRIRDKLEVCVDKCMRRAPTA